MGKDTIYLLSSKGKDTIFFFLYILIGKKNLIPLLYWYSYANVVFKVRFVGKSRSRLIELTSFKPKFLIRFRDNYTKPTCGLGKNHFAYLWFEKYHLTHIWYVLFVFHNPPLLKLGVNRYFCSNFMYLSSQNKKSHKNVRETRSKSVIGLSLNSHKSWTWRT